MNRSWLVGAVALALAVIVLGNTVFVLDQRRQAVVVTLDGPERVINPVGVDDPGVKVKIPFAEWLVTLDKRSQTIETADTPVTSADHQPLRVVAMLRYRITDPVAFYRSFGDEASGRERLRSLIDGAVGEALGRANATDIISFRDAAVMAEALADVRARATSARLGIEVLDLRVRRAVMPATAAEAAYQRMTVNLRRRAAQIRAQGEASRRDVMAGADKQATEILARADENATATRGAGDAQAAQLYAAAYGKDPRFAAFYRTMRAYQNALARKDTTLVLSPDNDFLKYFRHGPEAR